MIAIILKGEVRDKLFRYFLILYIVSFFLIIIYKMLHLICTTCYYFKLVYIFDNNKMKNHAICNLSKLFFANALDSNFCRIGKQR